MRIFTERLSRKNICEIANNFSKEYNSKNEIPVPIDLIVERDLNIDIVPLPGLRETLDNDGFISNDFTTIHIDQYVYYHIETRYRFSVAHETGHYWLHKSIFKELEFHDVKSWKDVYCSIDDNDYNWIEFQANNFAGFVLVPDFALKSIFSTVLTDIESKIEEAKNYDISQSDYIEHVVNLLAIRLAPTFNVSTACMVYRIRNDDNYLSLIP